MSVDNPGYHSVRTGDAVVTALNDGYIVGTTEYLAGIAGPEAEAGLRASHRALPPRLTISAFLIRQGGRVTLVDTGGAGLMGSTAGFLPRRLAALGVAPDAIDTVLLTHLHSDHVGGLVDGAGAAAFPRAELVMPAAERRFWFDPATEAQAPQQMRDTIALIRRVTAPYADRTRLAEPGEVLPGVTLYPLPGHTPGHSGYLVASGEDSLLIWADVVHVPGLQFARPEIGMVFDVDGAQAIATRRRAMDMAATEGLRIAGMHLDFPTFAHVLRDGAGYAVAPEVWMPD